ncbi:DMT family transporter [Faecalibacillus intestinalis]|uniref:DMT family transporter n=1 Tax=Faecalibacillus intestinalis TaxID=1982626 RepID=UPI0022E17771|nr:DMT family transporter [Faecalibacillus intestinalis]
MISIIFSILSGVTIVLSRSVNGMLSKKMGAYQGTFYNYFTGFMTSLILMLVLMIVGVQHINISLDKTNLMMYLGGIIGVFNILILNIIVPRISPVILTLLSFIGQLVSGMVIDAFVYNMFSISKILGCLIVIVGLVIYQLSEEKA